MMKPRLSKAGAIAFYAVAFLLAGTVITTAVLWWFGDWEEHGWGLTLTLRIVWGCWLAICLATVLTQITIFAWYFRRYFRWPEEAGPPPPAEVVPRPVKAPWPKSGAASFSVAVVLVSLTGGIAVAVVVLWILKDVLGDPVFWLVFKILGAVWWVSVIVTVLVRLEIFKVQMRRAIGDRPPGPPDDGPDGDAPDGPGADGPERGGPDGAADKPSAPEEASRRTS
jgi:hypothetical protein